MKKAAAALFLFLIPHLAAAGAKPEIFLKMGQDKSISMIRFSEDGKNIVTGDWYGSVRLWDIAGGEEVWAYQLEEPDEARVFFSKDGEEIYVAGENTVTILDRHTGISKNKLSLGKRIKGILFISEASKRILVKSPKNALEIIDLNTGETIQTLPRAAADLSAFDFSADGAMVVAGGETGAVRVWDVATGAKRIFKGHGKPIVDVAFSVDGKTFLSAGEDDTLRLWDVGTGKAIKIVKTEGVSVEIIKLTAGGKTAVTACGCGSLQLWDMEAGKKLRKFKVSNTGIAAIEISPDSSAFAMGNDDGDMYVWNISSGERVASFKSAGVSITAMAFSPDAKKALLGLTDGSMRLLDLAKGKGIRSFRLLGKDINAVAISPDGKRAASGYDNEKVTLWEIESGRIKAQYKMKAKSRAEGLRDFLIAVFTEEFDSLYMAPWVYEVAFSSDGASVIAGDDTGMIKVWDIKSGKSTISMGKAQYSSSWLEPSVGPEITSLALFNGGREMLAGDEDGGLILWDIASGEIVKTLEGHAGAIYSITISPNGKYAATGGWLDMVYLWDINRASVVKTFDIYKASGLAFTADGKYLLIADWEGKLKLWDAKSGESIREYEDSPRWIKNVVFSQDGKRIIAGSRDGLVAVWDFKTGEKLAWLAVFKGKEWTAITKDGYWAASEKGAKYLGVRPGSNVDPAAYLKSMNQPEKVEAVFRGAE